MYVVEKEEIVKVDAKFDQMELIFPSVNLTEDCARPEGFVGPDEDLMLYAYSLRCGKDIFFDALLRLGPPLSVCRHGTYFRSNMTMCSDCAIGHGSGWNATICTECLPGEEVLFGQCKVCKNGFFAPEKASDSCQKCPKGYVSDEQRTSCMECHRGMFERDAVCHNCSKGTFSSDPAAVACASCAIGKFSPNLGGTVCLECVRGTFSSTSEQSACHVCLKGEYAPNTASSQCIACQSGTFADKTKSSFCETCFPRDLSEEEQKAYTSKPGSISRLACHCIQGFYGKPFKGGVCKKCKESEGVSCPEANISLPRVAEGYFRSLSNPSVVYRCIPTEACASTEFGSATVCTAGYTGNNCGRCVIDDFYREGQFCKECTFVTRLSFIPFLFGVFVALFFLVKHSYAEYRRLVTLTVTGYWMQFLAIVSNFQAVWPPLVNWLFQLTSLLNFNFEVMAPECSFHVSYLAMYHIKMTSPLVLGAMQLVFFSYQETFNKNIFNAKEETNTKHMSKEKKLRIRKLRRSRYAFAYTIIQYSIHTMLVMTALEVFQCVRQADGSYLLYKSSDIVCFSDTWWRLFVTNIFFGGYAVFYAPYHMFTKMRRYIAFRGYENGFMYYGFLLTPYKEKTKYWAVVEMCFRSVVVIVAQVLGVYHRNASLAILIALIVMFDVLLTVVKPFKYRLHYLLTILYVCPW